MITKTTKVQRNYSFEAERLAPVEQAMARYDYQEDGLVEALIAAQESFGFLSQELLAYVSERLQVPLSRVYGVATFYDLLSLEPVGATDCLVCTGPVCAILGGQEILVEVRRQSGVPATGDTSPDGNYSVKQASCLGYCDQAPAALVNMKAQVNIAQEDIQAMLKGAVAAPVLHVSYPDRTHRPARTHRPDSSQGRRRLQRLGKSLVHHEP
jgi:bidirectional [NiFe] hydrogenase diaphorase subunit